jgi:oxygen-independent coproporphyrinogen-3 oxidase
LHRCGVNRLSIGAQSFDPIELKILARPHTSEAIGQAVAAARNAGFDNIGLDLIFGIPGQTVQTFAQSLSKAIKLAPTHLSAYSLTWENETPLTRALFLGAVQEIDEDDERAMYKLLCQMLSAAGFMQYEISNFAAPGFACRHNIRYWRNQPVIGLGPAAAGWYRGQRTANAADIGTYVERITQNQFAWQTDEQPGARQMASEMAVLGLRMTDGIDLAAFQNATGKNPKHLFANAIREHCKNGLLELTDTHLRLTEKGLSFADTVACDFIL